MMTKKFIRNSEAKIAVSALGLKPSNVYSLDLPFYGTRAKSKTPVSEKDYEVIRSLLRLIEPTVIFAAGIFIMIQATWPILTQPIVVVFRSYCIFTSKSKSNWRSILSTRLSSHPMIRFSSIEAHGRSGLSQCPGLSCPFLLRMLMISLQPSSSINRKKRTLCSLEMINGHSGSESSKEIGKLH